MKGDYSPREEEIGLCGFPLSEKVYFFPEEELYKQEAWAKKCQMNHHFGLKIMASNHYNNGL